MTHRLLVLLPVAAASLVACSNAPVTSEVSEPAIASVAAPVPLSTEYAPHIATADNALNACIVGQELSDLTCTGPVMDMVDLVRDIDAGLRNRADAGSYAELFITAEKIVDRSAMYSAEHCPDGFIGGFRGGPSDVACTQLGMAMRIEWQTFKIQMDTAEIRNRY